MARTTLLPALALCLALPALPAAAQDMAGKATLMNQAGEEVGTATVRETASGMMHIVVTASGIDAGVHGVHIHETGDCGDAFQAAGGHLADGRSHGIEAEGGPHPGDLPNAHVQSDGVLAMEAFIDGALLSSDLIYDADGSAMIIHAGADDYSSQPAGESGDRVACGVIEMAQ